MNDRILPQDPRGGNSRDKNRRASDRRKGDRRVGRRGRHKKDKGGGITTLIFLCVIALGALGAFLFFKSGLGTGVNWYDMFFSKDKQRTTFQLGDVSLGMSSREVKKQHPNLDLVRLGNDESVAKFNTDGAHYVIWFVNINGREKAYRMRYDQRFASRTETELLASIGNKHGKPGTSECSKAGELARKCHFQWWPSGGTALTVSTTEVKSKTGKTSTDLTMIATDTYLDGKRMRLLSKPPAVTPKIPQKKSPEKLPF
jgi:hypothetical protein